MTHTKKETISIGWCDPGTVDGKFADAITGLIMHCNNKNIEISSRLRSAGNQIGRQRQALFDQWADTGTSDWLLWIDSDIVITPNSFDLVWDAADKLIRPVVSGTYFISKSGEQTLMEPYAALFNQGENDFEMSIVHPLPENKIIKVDYAGFGFLLMHRSVVNPLRKVTPDYSLFAEKENLGDKYISEDITFFRNLKNANIPLYAHTGALVQHMKRFSLDINYYNIYWHSIASGIIVKDKTNEEKKI